MSYKKIYAQIFIKDGEVQEGYASDAAELFEIKGADGLIVTDLSTDEKSHEKTLNAIRKITSVSDIPLIADGNVRRLEDVKKYIYAGCVGVIVLEGAKDPVSGYDVVERAVSRFGEDKIFVKDDAGILSFGEKSIAPLKDSKEIVKLLSKENIIGIYAKFSEDTDFYKIKRECAEKGIDVDVLKPNVKFDDLKVNDAGLVPVIVQDYKSDEVLMMAWMNKEAFDKTCDTGVMTYFSRSRDSLWVKGETSGHFQYLKSMYVDCDEDTLLVKVKQKGAACHTGNRTCFYSKVLSKDYVRTNPMEVLSEVMDVIRDRKENPKKGSYTSYLFEQGIDKVLKKCGEEAAEIIIAAKNPDKEEIKYEIADYLYHVMVLMSIKDISWNEIMKELANR